MAASSALRTSDSALGMPARPGLYRIDFPNGKSYIGVSRTNMRVRSLNHFTDARRGNRTAVCNALRHYGSATFRALAICSDPETLSLMERGAIRAYETLAPLGYNIETGGLFPGPVAGFKHSAETRAKMSAARRGRPRTEAELRHLKDMAAIRGPVTDAQKAKIRDKLRSRGTPHWAIAANSMPLVVDGVLFASRVAAAAHFGISVTACTWRIKSPNFPEWSNGR